MSEKIRFGTTIVWCMWYLCVRVSHWCAGTSSHGTVLRIWARHR